MKKWLILLLLPVLSACSFVKYSFSGTSIQADVKTITIPYVEYKALRVNPSLSNDLTEALKEKFRKLTRLEQVEMNGDLELVCEITGYDVKATAITAKRSRGPEPPHGHGQGRILQPQISRRRRLPVLLGLFGL